MSIAEFLCILRIATFNVNNEVPHLIQCTTAPSNRINSYSLIYTGDDASCLLFQNYPIARGIQAPGIFYPWVLPAKQL